MQPDLCWMRRITPDAYVLREGRIEDGAVRPIGARNASHRAAIKANTVDVGVDMAPFPGLEVNESVLFIDAIERPNVPAPGRNLSHLGAIGFVVIEVLEPAALAEPEERAIAQPRRAAVVVHPRFGRFAQYPPLASRPGVADVQVEPRLLPVLHLKHHTGRVRRPVDIDNQKV